MPTSPDNSGSTKPVRLNNRPEAKEKLARLAATHATLAGVAQSFAITEAELDAFFLQHPKVRAVFDQAAAAALEQLRAAQFKLAEKSATMAIFIGKHYLGQGDRRELDQSAEAAESDAAERLRHKLSDIAARLGAAGDPGAGESL